MSIGNEKFMCLIVYVNRAGEDLSLFSYYEYLRFSLFHTLSFSYYVTTSSSLYESKN